VEHQLLIIFNLVGFSRFSRVHQDHQTQKDGFQHFCSYPVGARVGKFSIASLISSSNKHHEDIPRYPFRFFSVPAHSCLYTTGSWKWQTLPCSSWGPSGVTTSNPSLLERCNQPCTVENLNRLAIAVLSISEEFMCQAWGSTADEIYEKGLLLSHPDRDRRITIKVPY
jgi:hypothetical protein